MDIQKQRESFEIEFKKTNFYKGMVESLKNQDCPFTPIFEMRNGEYRNIYVNLSFEVWQQAQIVAVPEGFVLVPKEPTKAMLKTLSGYTLNPNLIYKAMIEAQEQVG